MVTVTRVLPWRRRPRATVEETSTLLPEFRSRHVGAATTLIERAYEVALAAHAGQTRKSGEPYINHPMSVATIVARQGLDDTTVAAALLHHAEVAARPLGDGVVDAGVLRRAHDGRVRVLGVLE